MKLYPPLLIFISAFLMISSVAVSWTEEEFNEKWSVAKDTVILGESTTYTIAGRTFEVTVSQIEGTTAMFTVNGESTSMLSEGNTEEFSDGTILGLQEVVYQAYGGGILSVEFYLQVLNVPLAPPQPDSTPEAEEEAPVITGACASDSDCEAGYSCEEKTCRIVLGNWWPPTPIDGLRGYTYRTSRGDLQREIVAEKFLTIGKTEELGLYGAIHRVKVLSIQSGTIVTLEIEGAVNHSFWREDISTRDTTSVKNLYTFPDGTYLTVDDVLGGGTDVRLAKAFNDTEYDNWIAYNSTKGPCRTVYDCPTYYRCVGGACLLYCGNGRCEKGENETCLEDCGRCGDDTCSEIETCATCEADCCGACGNGRCEGKEGCSTCEQDCTCLGTQQCVRNECITFCGNGMCEPGEETFCASDCDKLRLDVNGTIKEAEVKNGVITVGDVQARIRDTVFINDSKMFVLSASNETRRISILPDQIPVRMDVEEEDIISVDIGMRNERVVYTIQAAKRVRLLGFISISKRIESEIDAESGEIISETMPWWSFLASG